MEKLTYIKNLRSKLLLAKPEDFQRKLMFGSFLHHLVCSNNLKDNRSVNLWLITTLHITSPKSFQILAPQA